MKNLKQGLVDACVVVTITLAMLLGLELAARTATYAEDALSSSPEAPSTVLKQAWGHQYELDAEQLLIRHVDYVEFREAPYRSATINVDEEGRRRVPGNCEKAGAFVVWTFGGSTMFGYGAPDQFTIPAYLAGIFNREGRCARIVNFGAGSWQSTQSLIQLIESLKRSPPPHAIIFYDGVNDAYTGGSWPGSIVPDAKALLERGLLGPQQHSFSDHSRLVGMLANRVFGMPQDPGERARSAMLADIPGHTKAIASIYAGNVRIASLLAKEYGFDAYFFLQPYPIISAKKLTSTEEALMAHPSSWPQDRELFRSFYRAFRQEPALTTHPRFFDISGIFDGMSEELFADDSHLLPEGNRIVAERIAREIVLPPLQSSPAS